MFNDIEEISKAIFYNRQHISDRSYLLFFVSATTKIGYFFPNPRTPKPPQNLKFDTQDAHFSSRRRNTAGALVIMIIMHTIRVLHFASL